MSDIDEALERVNDDSQRDCLLTLKQDIVQLLTLAGGEKEEDEKEEDVLKKEYEQFEIEMKQEGAISKEERLREGSKCSAPFMMVDGSRHHHNAMICWRGETTARVLFTNPREKKMLPCPYFLQEEGCKFPPERCRFSHGESVHLSDLRDYREPKFDSLIVGSDVLAKQNDNLWYCGVIKRLSEERCCVRLKMTKEDVQVDLSDVFPLETTYPSNMSADVESSCDEGYDRNSDSGWIQSVHQSLMRTPGDEALGSWQCHTKGIGFKLLQKMGYVMGNGLGRNNNGRVEPVTAVILPAGKSLDYCMNLRERAGGRKDLFDVEKRLKRTKKRQKVESRRESHKESGRKKENVFEFLNRKLGNDDEATSSREDASLYRQKIRGESCRNLNIATLQTNEDLNKCRRELFMLEESLKKHTDPTSFIHKNLLEKLYATRKRFQQLETQLSSIKLEVDVRNTKKKLTVF